jgi:hypothetical protein
MMRHNDIQNTMRYFQIPDEQSDRIRYVPEAIGWKEGSQRPREEGIIEGINPEPLVR